MTRTETIDMVKKYFKDAITATCLVDGITYNISRGGAFVDGRGSVEYHDTNYIVSLFALGSYATIVTSKAKRELTLETVPERYASRMVNGMDVIAVGEHWDLNPQEFNILKYLLRDKGEDFEDMGKIVDYATREQELILNRKK